MQFVCDALRAKNRYQLRLATILLDRMRTTCSSHMSWPTLTALRSHFKCSLHLHAAAAPMRHLPSSCSSSGVAHTPHSVAYSWARRRPGNLCCCQCGRADFMWPDHVSSLRLVSCSVWFLWSLLWPKNKTTKRRQATALKSKQINWQILFRNRVYYNNYSVINNKRHRKCNVA